MKLKFKVYVLIEILIFISLLVFQIIRLNKGLYVFRGQDDYFFTMGVIKVCLTYVSFCYALINFFNYPNMKKQKEGLIFIYMFMILVADIFFSLTPYSVVGHVIFLVCYLMMLYIRGAKRLEYIIAAALMVVAEVVLGFTIKFDFTFAIDIAVCVVVVTNTIGQAYKYIKFKDKIDLTLLLYTIFVLISDLCIVLSAKITSPVIINHIASLLIWPTYIIDVILLNKYLEDKISINTISTGE